MDFADTQDEAAFRKRARAFLNDNAELKNQVNRNLATGWNKDEALAAARIWQAKKFESGFAGLVLPAEYRRPFAYEAEVEQVEEKQAALDKFDESVVTVQRVFSRWPGARACSSATGRSTTRTSSGRATPFREDGN